MVNFEIYGDLNFLVLQLQTVFGHRLLVVLFFSRTSILAFCSGTPHINISVRHEKVVLGHER
jgi:hypothetical protein